MSGSTGCIVAQFGGSHARHIAQGSVTSEKAIAQLSVAAESFGHALHGFCKTFFVPIRAKRFVATIFAANIVFKKQFYNAP